MWWLNYTNSLTWSQANIGIVLLTNHHSSEVAVSQWGRYNLHRYIYIFISTPFLDKPTSNQQLMTWFLVQDYITGRRVLSTPDISVPSPAQPFIKYSLPLVPCSWSIHGSRLAQRCNGLWGSSSANGLNGAQKHRGKIWQSKDSNGKPIRTQISMVTWTSQAHTTYSVCVCVRVYTSVHIYIYT